MSYVRNSLTYVWAFLTVITVASWALSRAGATAFHGTAALATTGVIALAAIKARFVFRYFMEVSAAPAWLKRTTDGWLVGFVAIVLGIYWYTVS